VKRLVIICAVVFAASAFGYWADWGLSGIKQPIQFPHKTHIALKIPCTGCHQRAEKDLVAGRPPTALCLACHASGDSKSAEIAKLRAFGDKGQDIPWQRVWRLPSHVFFSHRVHVTVAKLACQSCHGPMETLDRPPPRPLKTLAMEDCIACHMKSKANAVHQIDTVRSVNVSGQRWANDCVGCHR
jgi:hypothetical protein